MNPSYTYVSNLLDRIPDIPVDSIVSQTIYTDNEVKAILFAFAAGQELSEHTSSQVATLYFAQGEADVTLGDDRLTAQPGTWVHMPLHLPHSIVAKTPVVMLLTMYKPQLRSSNEGNDFCRCISW